MFERYAAEAPWITFPNADPHASATIVRADAIGGFATADVNISFVHIVGGGTFRVRGTPQELAKQLEAFWINWINNEQSRRQAFDAKLEAAKKWTVKP